MALTNEQRTAQTKQRIIDSTIRLFNDQGVQVTVDAICAGAGVGKGSVFNYFASKEKLLYDVFVICHSHAVEITEKEVDWEADVEDVVKQLLRNSAAWASEYPDEVAYTFNYHVMKKNDLFDVAFAHRVKSVIGDERIASRIKPLLPATIPWEYLVAHISNQNYQLGQYLADHPEYRNNREFIGQVIDSIWAGIARILALG